MAKTEELKVTPERLMQFGFAYAPPLIIGAAVANRVFQRAGREHHPNELRFRTGIGRAFETGRCDKPSARSRSRLGLGNLGNRPGAKIAAGASDRGGLGWHDSDNQTYHEKIWRG